MWQLCEWWNKPAKWAIAHSALHVTTEAHTDFWRETGYGYTRDSGHFFGRKIAGDFTARLRIRAHYEGQYDQAGLMLRISDSHWVKFGTEFFDGRSILSSVITAERSDWAIGAFAGAMEDFHLRATLKNGALHLEVSQNGHAWS
jgi:regulation of enolase protein 1 (concanavalin A-like superfamily)